jgi:hypothetical protein
MVKKILTIREHAMAGADDIADAHAYECDLGF